MPEASTKVSTETARLILERSSEAAELRRIEFADDPELLRAADLASIEVDAQALEILETEKPCC